MKRTILALTLLAACSGAMAETGMECVEKFSRGMKGLHQAMQAEDPEQRMKAREMFIQLDAMMRSKSSSYCEVLDEARKMQFPHLFE